MTSNVALKRIVAYLIDYLVITLISSALVYLTFINPRYDEYVEASHTYNEVLQNYYSGEIDANELSEQTRELSYELNSNGYVYTIGNIIIIFLYFGVFAYVTKGQIRAFILNGVILNILTLIAVCFKESTYLTIYSVASNFDMILMIILFLMILFYKDGRGLHDILAGTKVVDVRMSLEENNKEKEEIATSKNVKDDAEVEVIKPKKTKKTEKKKENE